LIAILGVISSVISAFYYLRVIKIMYFDEQKKSNFQMEISSQSNLILILTMMLIVFFIFYPSLLTSLGAIISIDYFQ
jgi:NADH-quinone oxidoreductase subunit N